MNYPDEVLDEDEDNGTMVESKEALAAAVIGHKIVDVRKGSITYTEILRHWPYYETGLLLTLDDGSKVFAAEQSDCCAGTEVGTVLRHLDQIDHAITGVGTTDGYNTWHIYADLGDVLEFTVDWSCGNPFYYAYGFNIKILPPETDFAFKEAITQ